MNLREMLITEEKMNNYIEKMNSVKGDQKAIRELLADRETYAEYLKYIGVRQSLYKNPAVIEGSAEELEKILMNTDVEATRNGIDCGDYTFGNTDGKLLMRPKVYFAEFDGKFERISNVWPLYESMVYSKYGLALEYHSGGMDHDYMDCIRNKRQYSYESYDGIATEDSGVRTDSGNPFDFRSGANPIESYQLYGSRYPGIGKWLRNFYPEYQAKFDEIDANRIDTPRFEYESTVEGKSDDELREMAGILIQGINGENSEKNAENNEKAQKIAIMLEEARRLTKRVNVDAFGDSKDNEEVQIMTLDSLPENIKGLSEEELIALIERVKEENRQVLVKKQEQEVDTKNIHSRIKRLTEQKEREDAAEAERMKNPIYRVKKKVRGFIEGKKADSHDDYDSRG